MHYVRYADDFVITIIGSKADAMKVKLKCAEFLKTLILNLHDDKTLITNPQDRSIRFLGYLIKKTVPKVNSYRRAYAGVTRKVSRMTSGNIYIKADNSKVVKRLHEKGFCRADGYPIPNFKYLSNTQHGAILQVNYVMRGLANYYSLANNSRQMISR